MRAFGPDELIIDCYSSFLLRLPPSLTPDVMDACIRPRMSVQNGGHDLLPAELLPDIALRIVQHKQACSSSHL